MEHIGSVEIELKIQIAHQRLALLQSTQACLKDAQTFQDGKECRSKRRQAGRQLLKEGRQVVNAERQRLGLSPLPTDLPFSF